MQMASNTSNPLEKSSSKIKNRMAVFAFFFSHGIVFSSWASRIPIIKEQLGLSDGELGSLLLMIPLGQLLTMPLVGKMVTKYGSEKILFLGIVLYGLALCFIGLAQTFTQLAAVLFLFGTFSNMSNIAINTQGVLVENKYGRSIMTSFHGAWSIAGFIGALIGILMFKLDVSTFFHFVIIYLVLLILVIYNRPFLIKTAQAEQQQKEKGFQMDRMLLILGGIGFCSMAVEGAMFDWSGVYFKDIIQAQKEYVVVGFASFMIMMATGRFIGDKVIQKVGAKKTLFFSGMLMFSGMILSVVFPNIWVCMFAFMLIGVGVACNVPIVYAIGGKHPTISSGIAIAMISTISFLGFLLGPPLIGYIAELLDLRYSFAIFAFFGLIMSLLSFQIHLPRLTKE